MYSDSIGVGSRGCACPRSDCWPNGVCCGLSASPVAIGGELVEEDDDACRRPLIARDRRRQARRRAEAVRVHSSLAERIRHAYSGRALAAACCCRPPLALLPAAFDVAAAFAPPAPALRRSRAAPNCLRRRRCCSGPASPLGYFHRAACARPGRLALRFASAHPQARSCCCLNFDAPALLLKELLLRAPPGRHPRHLRALIRAGT